MSAPLQRIEGKYEIVAKIRDGGMGAVYRVRHRLLDELRVVKVLRPIEGHEDEMRVRFAQEARSAIRLRHPNVVQIHDFTLDDDGVGFIVMEHIEGADLEKVIATRRPISLPLILEMTRQTLRALGYLHRNGFVHRDVSPDNIMLTHDVDGDPLIKLIDLGIAKNHEQPDDLTLQGTFLGKFRYASPEHFETEGPAEVTAKSDLYSLGLILFELLTGHHPITGEDAAALVAGHLYRPPRSFTEADPDGTVPAEIRSLVLRAMARDPAERYEDAGSFAEALAGLQPRYPVDRNVREEIEVHLAASAEARVGGRAGSTQHRLDAGFDLHEPTTVAPMPLADAEPSGPPARDAETAVPETVDELLRDGRGRAAAGDVAGAIRTFEEALARRPQDSGIHRLLDQAMAQRDGASHDWRRAVDQELEAAEAALAKDEPDRAAAAIEQARTLVDLPPPVAEAEDVLAVQNRLAAAETALADTPALAERIAGAIERIRALVAEGHLVEADRAVFQASERFGHDVESLRALRDDLNDVHRRRRKERIDELVTRAETLADEEQFAAALDHLHRARAAAPEGSELEAELEARGDALQIRANEHDRHRAVVKAERAILRLIRERRLDEADRLLHGAEGRFGTVEPFDALRSIVEKTRAEDVRGDRVTKLLAEAREHLVAERFPEAAERLREAAVLAPDDEWIRARLTEAEAETAERGDVDEEVDAVRDRARNEAEQEAVREALLAVDERVEAGDAMTAWRLLREAIDVLGPAKTLVARRHSLADLMLEAGDPQAADRGVAVAATDDPRVSDGAG